MKNPPNYSIVVPVYNSEGSLPLLRERLEKVFAAMGASWELILVNDYSRDGSWNVMRSLAAGDPRVKGVNLANNFGQHNALMCGFSYASGGYVVTIDDDLQHPPEEVPKLIKAAKEGNYRVVYGQFSSERKYGWFRNIASNAINGVLSKITGSGYKVTQFRVMEGKVARRLAEFPQYNVMIDVLIKDTVGARDIGHCNVAHHERTIGKSGYSLKKLFGYAMNMIFSFTLWPLRLASTLGIFFSGVAVLIGLVFLGQFLFYGISVEEWTTLILTITLFFGITLFVLGVIGEYLGRMFLNVNRKPQYVVKETLNAND